MGFGKDQGISCVNKKCITYNNARRMRRIALMTDLNNILYVHVQGSRSE